MADRVQKYVKPYVIGHSDQLLQYKFFDLIIPSMRTSKIQNGHQGASKWPTGSTPRFFMFGTQEHVEYSHFEQTLYLDVTQSASKPYRKINIPSELV